MKRVARLLASFAAAVFTVLFASGCVTRAYVGLTPGEGVREVNLQTGALVTLRREMVEEI